MATDRRRQWPRRLLGVVVLATASAAVAVAVGRQRTERAVDRLVARLLGDVGSTADRRVTSDDLAALPDPVRRYVDTVLEEGRPYVRTVSLTQRGEFKLGTGDDAWKPMTATQWFATDPPGFVWDAEIGVAPGLSARVVDRYVDREGALWARLLGAVPIVDVEPGPEVNESELVRYLGEAVWFPTALLGEGVEWESIDDSSARATIRDGDVTASLVFQFDERGVVERVHTDERYRQETDDHAPWTGSFRDYRVRNGVLVPTEAEVAWDPPAGDGRYWRATIESIDYDVDAPAEE